MAFVINYVTSAKVPPQPHAYYRQANKWVISGKGNTQVVSRGIMHGNHQVCEYHGEQINSKITHWLTRNGWYWVASVIEGFKCSKHVNWINWTSVLHPDTISRRLMCDNMTARRQNWPFPTYSGHGFTHQTSADGRRLVLSWTLKTNDTQIW